MSRLPAPIFPKAVFIFGLIFSLAVYFAQQSEITVELVRSQQITLATTTLPVLSAPVFRVFDLESGVVLLSQGESTVVPIASVTKLFTATTLASNFNLQSTTSIEWSDVATEGGSGKLKYGQTYSYQELLFPLLIESSNDAAAALARDTAGELINKMNAWAATLGASATVFTDTSGLGESNVSTVADLQILLTDAYKNQPHIFDITTLPQYIGSHTGWHNNNPVAGEIGYRGGKNGYTIASNRTLVTVFSETINGQTYTLGYIILGSDDIKADFSTLRQFINNSAS